MIEDIKKLRRRGLSFRKIANELDSTVGKVQYQWSKYKKNEENEDIIHNKQAKNPSNCKLSDRTHFWYKRKLPSNEHLTAWLVSKNKLFVFWRLLEEKKDLISNYYDKPFNSYQKVIRIYDVTHILFNGNNAHQIREFILEEGQEKWIQNDLQPNRCYITELGIKLSESDFFPLLRSNAVHVPRTNPNQTGNLKKEIDQYLTNEKSVPNWVEHVSTYSYYDKIKREDE
jgi:uncharacterized protein